MPRQALWKSIKDEVKEIHRGQGYPDDEISFTHWYLRTFLCPTTFEGYYEDTEIADSICHQKNELKIDAIYKDFKQKKYYIVQTKYRKDTSSIEEYDDIHPFLKTGYILINGEDKEFEGLLTRGANDIKNKLRNIKRELNENDYQIELKFVTSGKVREKDESDLKRAFPNLYYEIITSQIIENVYEDFIEVGQPPIPLIKLNAYNEIIDWQDEELNVGSWVFPIKGKELIDIYRNIGRRIFARNIRGFLGITSKSVNKAITETAVKQPSEFLYRNNGITIICSHAVRSGGAGKNTLEIRNAQIINGQQTIRVLDQCERTNPDEIEKIIILLKLFVINPEVGENRKVANKIIDDIVEGTNTQSVVTIQQLKSNTFRQIWLQKELLKNRINYKRKKGFQEGKRHGFTTISHEDIDRALGTVLIGPEAAAIGNKNLYENFYDKLFKKDNIYYYLFSYQLFKLVENTLKNIEINSDYRNFKYIIVKLMYEYLFRDLSSNDWVLGKKFVDFATISNIAKTRQQKNFTAGITRTIKKLHRVMKDIYKNDKSKKIGITVRSYVREKGFYNNINNKLRKRTRECKEIESDIHELLSILQK